jgi:RHS repeat-associated protein
MTMGILLHHKRSMLLLVALLVFFVTSSPAVTTGSITIGGPGEQINPSTNTWDTGSITITITVNGSNYVRTVQYGQFSTFESIASALAANIASDCYSPVSAKSAPGGVIYFQTRKGGNISQITINNNGSISFNSGSQDLSVAPTTTVASIGALDLQSGQTTTVNVQVSCKMNCGNVDYRLDGGEWQTKGLDQNGQASLTTNAFWSPGLHNVIVQYQGNGSYMTSVSNPVSFMINGTQSNQTSLYSYSISSYALNGNVQAYKDSVNGTWNNIQYDGVNRMTAATQSINSSSRSMCWSYDSYGNRTAQMISGSPCSNPPATVSYNANNQVQGFQYDAAGNVTFDGTNYYLYDAEGRVCAVQYPVIAGLPGTIGYVYDAEGRRVAKGTISSFNCNFDPSNPNSFQETHGYQLGPNGEQIAETDGAGNWLHTKVFANGQLIATYDSQGVHFHLTDWLGTRRVQADYQGNLESTYQNLPFGEMIPANQSLGATEHFFTGKERDSESGLDFFGARYYSANMGRWISPDWGAKEEPVPYAKLDNPQTLNLYGYVQNNPLSRADPDGHQDPCDCIPWYGWTTPSYAGQLANDIVAGAQQRWNNFKTDVTIAAVAVSVAANVLLNEAKPSPDAPAPTKAYDTGTANDLKGNSQVGDGLDIHHVPQSQPASQTVEGYDKGTAPAIALPKGEHQSIPTERGDATRSPRDQLAKDVRDLRNNTNTPNTQIQKLVQQNKQQYPEMNKEQ